MVAWPQEWIISVVGWLNLPVLQHFSAVGEAEGVVETIEWLAVAAAAKRSLVSLGEKRLATVVSPSIAIGANLRIVTSRFSSSSIPSVSNKGDVFDITEEKSLLDYNRGNPDGILDPGERPRPPRRRSCR